MNHGEYKTPGGKLVEVDFRVEGGFLRDVEVSGDFFLYPEESFAALAPALEGAGAGLGRKGFADRIAAALPPGTNWLGSSPEALATAVERALEAGDVS